MSSPFIASTGTDFDRREADHEVALLMEAQRNQMRQINALLDDLNTANARIGSLIREKTDVEVRFDNFRTEVREMAIEKAEELNWCTPGLNAALVELGLDPKTRHFDVTFEVTQRVTVTVEAADEYEAKTQATNGYDAQELATSYASRYEWEAEIYEVEEADE